MPPEQNAYSSSQESVAPRQVTISPPAPGFASTVAIVAGVTLCGFLLDNINSAFIIMFVLVLQWPLGDWLSWIGLGWLWGIVWPHILYWPAAVAFGVAIGVLVRRRWLIASLCGGFSYSYGWLLFHAPHLAAQFGPSAVVSLMGRKAVSVVFVVGTAFLASRMMRGRQYGIRKSAVPSDSGGIDRKPLQA